jgi:activating signal cointegrator complex subunit 1
MTDPSLGVSELVATKAMRPIGSLHLTLGVMSLTDPEVLKEVTGVLEGLDLRELWRDAQRPGQADEQDRCSEGGTEGGKGAGAKRSVEKSLIPPSLPPDTLSKTSETTTVTTTATASSLTRPISPPPLTSSSKAKAKSPPTPHPSSPSPTPQPRITLRGLSTFRSPSKATVLYAPPSDPTGTLQRFAEALHSGFKQFMVGEDRPLRLHATIVNTLHVPRGAIVAAAKADRQARAATETGDEKAADEHGERNGQDGAEAAGGGAEGSSRGIDRKPRGGYARKHGRLTFDASPVIDRFRDTVWMADVPLERVAVMKMGAQTVRDGEGRAVRGAWGEAEAEYVAVAEVLWPADRA